MSRHTPLIVNGCLSEPALSTHVMLDTPAWHAWLADAKHTSFHFRDPAGEFTARKERKQRGTDYWVAYRQAHNHLYKRYLGKAESLTLAHLIDVAAALAAACTAPAAPHDP
jgi:LuxR family transcriptional regulator, maltose regulon positive regulatory protein